VLVTHKTHFADAFGVAGDVGEAEAFVYKPNAVGPALFVGRIKAAEWTIASN
jgi:hypothetical protein